MIPADMASQLARTFQSCYNKHRDRNLKPAPPCCGGCWIQISRVSQLVYWVAGQALSPALEQSGAFLDHCQPVPLAHVDFPGGEQSAAALMKLSEGLLGNAGV